MRLDSAERFSGGGFLAGMVGGRDRRQEAAEEHRRCGRLGLRDHEPDGPRGPDEVKRLAVGETLTVSVRGTPFVLEVGAGANAKGVAEEFERAQAPA